MAQSSRLPRERAGHTVDRQTDRWLPLLVFVVLAGCFLYIPPRWSDWNQNSRFDLVLAIVNDQTTAIDRYVANTGDYAHFRGHSYSDKAPGLSLLGVPVYALLRHLVPASTLERWRQAAGRSAALGATLRTDGTGLASEKLEFFIGLVLTTALTVALPSALLGVLIYWVGGLLGLSGRASALTALCYGLATSAFPYSNTFVGHQPAAVMLFGAFTLLLAIRWRGLSRHWLVAVGFCLGFAVITEYPTILVGALVGLYALWALPRRLATLGWLVVGGLPPLALLAGYDQVTFGTPLPIGYFHSALWTDVHQTGLVSLTYPHFEALWGITFGAHRGLFLLSPYLLFALPGYQWLWKRRALRAELMVLALAPLAFLLFNGSSVMWQGGFSIGPRYLVPALPFLALVAGLGLAATWSQRVWRPLIIATVTWSFLVVWALTLGGQSFPDYSANPLLDYSLPRLLGGDIARNAGMVLGLNGWLSLVPLVLAVVIGLLIVGCQSPRPSRLGPVLISRRGSHA